MQNIAILKVITIITLTTSHLFLVLRKDQNGYKTNNNLAQYDNSRSHRYLVDGEIYSLCRKYEALGSRASDKRIRLMLIANKLLRKSRHNPTKISQPAISPKTLKVLGGSKALNQLNTLINDKNFGVKYRFEKKHYRMLKNQQRLNESISDAKHKLKKHIQAVDESNHKLEQSIKEITKVKRKLEEVPIKYKPSMNGMPFPQFAISGINYHPPMHITINSPPYPNKRALEGPYSIAKKQRNIACKIKSPNIY